MYVSCLFDSLLFKIWGFRRQLLPIPRSQSIKSSIYVSCLFDSMLSKVCKSKLTNSKSACTIQHDVYELFVRFDTLKD